MHTPRGLIVKNKHLAATSSCQVSSENGYSKTPTIATRQKAQSPKAALIKHFRANKKPPVDKIPFINRWYLIWRRRRDLNPRAGHPTYALSRGAPSATWVLLRIIVYTIYLAEREGFEPPAPFGVTGFQDQLHKPLGHLSLMHSQ
jgi:hypothetical protein